MAASALSLVKSVEPNIITIQVSNCETCLEKIRSTSNIINNHHRPVLHQRGELGLLAVQEVANECLLKEVHKVNRPEPATQLLCRMEGPFTFYETLSRLSDSICFHFFLRLSDSVKSLISQIVFQ